MSSQLHRRTLAHAVCQTQNIEDDAKHVACISDVLKTLSGSSSPAGFSPGLFNLMIQISGVNNYSTLYQGSFTFYENETAHGQEVACGPDKATYFTCLNGLQKYLTENVWFSFVQAPGYTPVIIKMTDILKPDNYHSDQNVYNVAIGCARATLYCEKPNRPPTLQIVVSCNPPWPSSAF